MATELGLLSLTQLQKLAQSQQHQQPNPSWMLNKEDDESWEVRAFAEDTGNIMGTTWPPRSYTCTFCRREFRSAQALGGHMNVHRRDRARLHQTQLPGNNIPNSSTSTPTLIIPTQEFATNGGLCLLYQLPNPNHSNSNEVFTPTSMTSCAIDSPSTRLSISPYPPPNFPVTQPQQHQLQEYYNSSRREYPSCSPPMDSSKEYSAVDEDLDLELRLGRHRPTTS